LKGNPSKQKKSLEGKGLEPGPERTNFLPGNLGRRGGRQKKKKNRMSKTFYKGGKEQIPTGKKRNEKAKPPYGDGKTRTWARSQRGGRRKFTEIALWGTPLQEKRRSCKKIPRQGENYTMKSLYRKKKREPVIPGGSPPLPKRGDT